MRCSALWASPGSFSSVTSSHVANAVGPLPKGDGVVFGDDEEAVAGEE